MKSAMLTVLSTLVMVEFVLGNFANAFIALVNFIDWLKRQKLMPGDGILTALAVSRMALLWVMLMYFHSTVFNPALYSGQVRTTVVISWAVFHHFSTWFATILCMFYFFKIANFSNCFFLYLKKHIHNVILLVLLGSLLFLYCHIALMNAKEIALASDDGGNLTQKNSTDTVHFSNIPVLTVVNLVPFTMSLLCLLLLIHSLYKHVKQMQLSGRGSQDPSTKIHVKALQTMLSFLFLLAAYFFFVMAIVWSFSGQHSKPFFILCNVLAFTCPSIHSFVLILISKKLNQTFWWMLGPVRCRLNKQTPSKS
ncbi:taste receptor type 2 member 31-like [Ochotona princeps]|uniref:taste receptor type 2 member 31-like n=1 Tax=Ochotona princeps TaxID=9978 RepID=UPI0027153A24|nr:taste receptor type 2 member 31-like [Ochotona princeps]